MWNSARTFLFLKLLESWNFEFFHFFEVLWLFNYVILEETFSLFRSFFVSSSKEPKWRVKNELKLKFGSGLLSMAFKSSFASPRKVHANKTLLSARLQSNMGFCARALHFNKFSTSSSTRCNCVCVAPGRVRTAKSGRENIYAAMFTICFESFQQLVHLLHYSTYAWKNESKNMLNTH